MKKTKVVPKFAIAPAKFKSKGKHSGIKPNSKYEIFNYKIGEYGDSFFITSPETGQLLFCLVKSCAHLNGLNWILE
jgi:hypothetical protein